MRGDLHTHTHTPTQRRLKCKPKCAQLWRKMQSYSTYWSPGESLRFRGCSADGTQPWRRWGAAALPANSSEVSRTQLSPTTTPRLRHHRGPFSLPPSLRASVSKHWPSVQTSAAVACLSLSLLLSLLPLSVSLEFLYFICITRIRLVQVAAAGLNFSYF